MSTLHSPERIADCVAEWARTRSMENLRPRYYFGDMADITHILFRIEEGDAAAVPESPSSVLRLIGTLGLTTLRYRRITPERLAQHTTAG